MSEIKLCKDCTFCGVPRFLGIPIFVAAKCQHPNAIRINPVTGAQRGYTCSIERRFPTAFGCGPSANNFIPKP